ncbi:MAG: hypothetical protein WDO73_00875 [Ignavibacteriota bacterium]
MARIFAFIAGGDNRLSLSRLQAFAWTLVIFGSFGAAMAVHNHIASGTVLETRQKTAAAKQAVDTDDAELKSADARLTKARQLLDEAKTSEAAAEVTASTSQSLANAASTDKDTLQKKALDDRLNYDKLHAQRTGLETSYQNTLAERKERQTARDLAEIRAGSSSSDWVQIPLELLALAGIAIGSGVFSSVISALNAEGKTACVTAIRARATADLTARFPQMNAPSGSRPLLIEGVDLTGPGRARMGSVLTPILFWSGDGTAVVVDSAPVKSLSDLVVETAHGKLAYIVTGTLESPELGRSEFVYDLGDLFRDDKSPSTFSLMKFQMFGWTVVAIGIYSWLFLSNLDPSLSALPRVDPSVVILTGLSQSGYLVSKAVSNVGKTDP